MRHRAQCGALLYFDPPHDPGCPTASFTACARGGFGEADQARLRDLLVELGGRGVRV